MLPPAFTNPVLTSMTHWAWLLSNNAAHSQAEICSPPRPAFILSHLQNKLQRKFHYKLLRVDQIPPESRANQEPGPSCSHTGSPLLGAGCWLTLNFSSTPHLCFYLDPKVKKQL